MKPTLSRLLVAVFALGFGADLTAAEQRTFAEVSLVHPGDGKGAKAEFITLVVEGPDLFYETSRIPSAEVVAFVNGLLLAKKVSYIGVYAREGTKFGEVVRAIDLLRLTEAKNIGLSTSELPFGREPK